MDKKFFAIGLMLIMMALPIIMRVNLSVGKEIFFVAASISSILFALMGTTKHRLEHKLAQKICKWSTEKEGDDNQYRTISLMFTGLSILCVGELFFCQSYPGATPMRWIGGLIVLLSSLANLFMLNNEKCPYSTDVKLVSCVAILFALVGMTDYYWSFLGIPFVGVR